MSAVTVEALPKRSGVWKRRSIWSIAVLAVVGLATGSLAWLGMLPWHAPLDPGPYGVIEGMRTPQGHQIAYNSLWLVNTSRVDATLDSVTLASAAPGLRIADAWFPAPERRCGLWATGPSAWRAPDACKIPISGFVVPSRISEHPRLVVVLVPEQQGLYRSRGFEIRYHVGAISYTTTYGAGFVLRSVPSTPDR